MASSFATESVLVGPDMMARYLGLKDSSSLAGAAAPYYTSGLVKYEIFIPDPAAVATAGLTGSRLPALVQMHAQGTGEWTGTLASPTGNPGGNTVLPGQPGDKLGRNTTPVTDIPFYAIFPQFTLDWDGVSGENSGVNGIGTVSVTAGNATFSTSQAGVLQGGFNIRVAGVDYLATGFDGTTHCTLSGSPTFGASAFFVVQTSSGTRKQRATYMILEAVVKDAMAKYPIDPRRLILTGVSSGGSQAYGYLNAHSLYPSIFTLDFAGFIGIATWIGANSRFNLPESPGNQPSGEDYTLATVHRVAQNIVRLNIPLYLVNSVNDTTIAPGDLTTPTGPTGWGYLSTHAALRRFYPLQQSVASLSTPSRDYYDCGEMLQIIEYTGGAAPTHNNTWPMAYSNNITGDPMRVGDPMWAWMLRRRRGGTQRLIKRAA